MTPIPWPYLLQRETLRNDRPTSAERAVPMMGSTSSGAAATTGLIFDALWRALREILGSAATAMLVRRSQKRAVTQHPDLQALRILHTNYEYRYELPPSWTAGQAGLESLRALARELQPLLIELTGSVVTRRLAAVPELTNNGISFKEEPG